MEGFLFVVSYHSIRAWKLVFLFEVVFRKGCKYISGSSDFRKSSCSTSKDGEKRKAEECCSTDLFLAFDLAQSPAGCVCPGPCAACSKAQRCKINSRYNGLSGGSTYLST